MWEVPDHIPTLASPIEGIRTCHELTSMRTTTLTTQLCVTLGFSIIALLGARLVPFGISVPGRSRIT